MREKLTVEEFLRRKEELLHYLEETGEKLGEEENNSNFDVASFEKEAIKQYFNMQEALLSYDLRDIPFEAWEGFVLMEDQDGTRFPNFEGTFANIDFNIIETYDISRANFKSCNISDPKQIPYKLREEEFFDRELVEKSNIFLSSSFDNETKKKILNRTITIEDIALLSNEQLKEMTEKGYTTSYSNVEIDGMINAFGFIRMKELYQYSKDAYQEVSSLIHKLGYSYRDYESDITKRENDSFLELLKQSRIEDILPLCDERVRKNILENSVEKINLKDYTKRFQRKNEDIFLQEKEMPDWLREKYYAKELSLKDVLDHLSIFKDAPFEFFLTFLEAEEIKKISSLFGTENFHTLLVKYEDVFQNIPMEELNSLTHAISKEEIETLSYEDIFYQMIKQYILKQKIDPHALPDYFSSMNFKIVDSFSSMEELLQYDKNTILCDPYQNEILQRLGIYNLQKLEANTKFFTSEKTSFSIYDLFWFSQRGLSYDAFENQFVKFLREKKKIYDYSFIEGDFRKRHSDIFLDPDAPYDLQVAFYKTGIHSNFLKTHPEYIDLLREKDLRVVFDELPNGLLNSIYDVFGQKEGFDFLLLYESYITGAKIERIEGENLTKEELLTQIDEKIKNAIDKGMKYDSSMPTHFKNRYPNLFVKEHLKDAIKEKFYKKELTLEDFEKNMDLLEQFDHTNILYGFPSQFLGLTKLFQSDTNFVLRNTKYLKAVSIYDRVLNMELEDVFNDYLKEENYEVDVDKMDDLVTILKQITLSNASEMNTFCNSFAKQLLKSDAPMDSLEQMEEVFIKNNLPMVGKMFRCFQILYPNLEEFNFTDHSRMAPMLQNSYLPHVGLKNGSPTDYRFMILYNDMIRNAVKSGSRDLLSYLSNLEEGNTLLEKIERGEQQVSTLSKEEKSTLTLFLSHLETLYQNTEKGKKDARKEESLEEKLSYYKQKMEVTSRYDLKDRIVRSFAYFAGYPSYASMKEDIKNTIKDANRRNKERAEELKTKKFQLEEGDFLRSIGDFKVLGSSLNTGNYSKEYLATFTNRSESDTTPLDVDFTRIKENKNIYDAIKGTPTGFGFGNVYVVLRKDNPNLVITREKDQEEVVTKYDPKKLEMFQTGYDNHYGIRTGFSFTDVDYILYKKNLTINKDQPYDVSGNVCYLESEAGRYDDLNTIKFELARNGLYIPVVDFSGNLIYTEEEYQDLREKMDGLSYYGTKEYHFSSHLVNEEIEEIVGHLKENEEKTKEKREKIDAMIENALSVYNEKTGSSLTLKREIDGDLTPSSVELIDTGSTGRSTNSLGEGDFDFLLRVDRELMQDEEKYKIFKGTLREELTKYKTEQMVETNGGDFRYKGVETEDGTSLDVDISFAVKTNKIAYSTDACLKDRLDTIKSQDEEKYQYVVGNILLAKQFFKENHIYKPKRSDETQGGMGGSGIENWILQHGGSFYDAAKSFVEASKNKNFDEFKASYTVWDFGENHFAERNKEKTIEEKRGYLHDNFIADNMNALGYSNMVEALNKYVMEQEKKQTLEGKAK